MVEVGRENAACASTELRPLSYIDIQGWTAVGPLLTARATASDEQETRREETAALGILNHAATIIYGRSTRLTKAENLLARGF
jgi:hypothetical protein